MRFFTAYSEQHEGWMTTVELLDKEIGDQVEAQDLPLQGISFETRGSDRGDITILAGNTPESHIMHVISRPARVWIHESERAQAIEIESEGGGSTLIRVKSERQPSLTGANR